MYSSHALISTIISKFPFDRICSVDYLLSASQPSLPGQGQLVIARVGTLQLGQPKDNLFFLVAPKNYTGPLLDITLRNRFISQNASSRAVTTAIASTTYRQQTIGNFSEIPTTVAQLRNIEVIYVRFSTVFLIEVPHIMLKAFNYFATFLRNR